MNTHRTLDGSGTSLLRRGSRIGSLLTTALLLGLTACGSSGSGRAAGAEAESEAGKAAQTALEKQAQPFDTPKDPGPPINVSALRGKTVFYVPIALKVAHFPLVEKNLTEALGKAGVKLYSCDGQSNPSGVAACLDQAISRKAAAVITDYIPYEMASTAFEGLRKSGIPTYVAAELPPAGVSTSKNFAFGNPDAYARSVMEGEVDAVIADSDGDAHVLFLKVIQSGSTTRAGDMALEHFEEACPVCEVTVKEVTIAQIKDTASLVSSALISDPTIGYVIPQYDTYLSGAISGIQAAGKARDVKLATSGATLSVVQLVKENEQLIAVSGTNPPYIAWSMADAVLRLLTGQEPPAEYPVMTRTFTKDNVADLSLTPAAEVSGDWFGDAASYKEAFLRLWGVS